MPFSSVILLGCYAPLKPRLTTLTPAKYQQHYSKSDFSGHPAIGLIFLSCRNIAYDSLRDHGLQNLLQTIHAALPRKIASHQLACLTTQRAPQGYVIHQEV